MKYATERRAGSRDKRGTVGAEISCVGRIADL